MTAPPDPRDEDLERDLRRLRSGLDDAPEHVVQRTVTALHTLLAKKNAEANAPGLLQRIVAALAFDSAGASPLVFGVRSAGNAPTRQLLFNAHEHDVDLRVAPAADAGRWQLSGQVLGPDAAGRVELTDADGHAAGDTTLDALGEFRLPAVAAGDYVLSLKLGRLEIVLPAIAVR